jgi:hypothetical protein
MRTPAGRPVRRGPVTRHVGDEPDAGRRLHRWATDAGFGSVTSIASAWCFADEEDLAWWSTTWAERLTASPFGHWAIELGLSSDDELAALARGLAGVGRHAGRMVRGTTLRRDLSSSK